MAVEQGQYTDCLNCGNIVRIRCIDNMDDAIDPCSDLITMTFSPCKCGFVTVLEYERNRRYTLQTSREASNQLAGKDIWYAHDRSALHIGKEEEE